MCFVLETIYYLSYMKALMKSTNEPESRESLFGTALLSASIGAIAFYLTRFYYNIPFAYDSGLLFRGAWALGPLVYLPWMVIVGAMAGRTFGKVRNAKQMFGIMGALSVAVIVYMSVRLISPNFFTGYYVWILSYGYLLPSMACFMIGAYHSSKLQRLHDGRTVSIMLFFAIIAMAVYLVCEYLLRGYTSPIERPVFGIGAVLLDLISSLGVIVASLCIAGLCRSEVAARLTRPLLVRILLIALCVPPSLWQVLMFFGADSWNGPMRFVWVASPLFVLVIAGVSRLIRGIRMQQ